MNAVRETLLKNVRDFVETHERDFVREIQLLMMYKSRPWGTSER